MGPKIAIVGGGIGGLTAAVALARRGLAAEVYEQAPVLEEAGAGVGLWPNAMTALEPIGLSGKVARLAVKVGRQGLRRSDGTWLMSFPGEPDDTAVGGRVRPGPPGRAAAAAGC